MHARAAIPLAPFLLTLLVTSCIPGRAFALSTSEETCQATIGEEAGRFAAARHQALVRCANADVRGTGCNTALRDRQIGRAADRLARVVTRRCSGVDLATLGFPGACPSPAGPTFTRTDLLACLEDSHAMQIDMALATEYPSATPALLARGAARCQRQIGRLGQTFIERKQRARSRCLDQQLQGRVAPAVDCRAEPPPFGPGTGDADTDRAIVQAMNRLTGSLARACAGVVLEELGFPGACPDATGAPFSLADLQSCIRDTHEEKTDALIDVEYPAGTGATPTPPSAATATPTDTGTATPTAPGVTPTATPTSPGASPSPSPTVTPPPSCGNDTVDAGEECDGTDDALCPGRCLPSCTCAPACVLPDPLPEVLSLVAKTGIDLDTGWTGQSHDLRGVAQASLTAVRLRNCDTDPASPTCGQCSLEGPILFPGASRNCQCVDLAAPDTSSLAVCDPEAAAPCSAPETCECFYGPPLPISSGAVPVCVVNRYAGPIEGTANVADAGPDAGASEALIRLTSVVHNGLTVDQPCPVCAGDTVPLDGVRDGACDAGPKEGDPCDVSGSNPFFGNLSFDCPPPSAASIGTLNVVFDPATTGTTTLGTGIACTAIGAAGAQCFCDTCATAAAEPCRSDADCPAGVPCGARRCLGGANNGVLCAVDSECPAGFCNRPGDPTAPNACVDGVCSANPADPDNPNEGLCEAGPIDPLCSTETFRGCTADADCNPPPLGNCATCLPNQVCGAELRECFLDPIVRTGMPGTQMAVIAATFCISPTSSPAVNTVGGLPGPGSVLLPTQIFRSGALCGDGTLDAGEECDPPLVDACIGACQPDCTCGPFCGDAEVNQPGEQCDGPDQGACTAGCLEDCTCAPVCGDGIREGAEECDQSDDAACPGLCQGDCTCGPFCGDGSVDPGEECDGMAPGGACPASACQSDCTCGPFCGDGTIDAGEQCDGATTGACPGTCAIDCTCAPFCGNGIVEGGELCDGAADAACPGACQADCRCPAVGTLSFVVKPGSDLDNGWTGQSHDAVVQAGSTIAGEISGCDGAADSECAFLANVGSFCSGDPSRTCTSSAQCLGEQTCVLSTYGPPLPLSSGGVPVCIVNRFAGDVTGTHRLDTGATAITVPLNSLVHFSPNVSQPCPVCDCGKASLQDCAVGESGTCVGSAPVACTVEATGPFGPTSNDCPPNPAANVSGGGVNLAFAPATTGLVSFPSNQPCEAAGFESLGCWCDRQLRPNACQTACAAGDQVGSPCGSDDDCPGGGVGACTPLCVQAAGEPVGEGECAAGPADQRCAGAEEIGCMNDEGCPAGTGPCETGLRRCFMDPIVREGMPGTTMNELVSAHCIPATSATAIDANTGLPGPGAVRLPNQVDARLCGDGVRNRATEDCDGADDDACPGSCQMDCTCPRTCGNDVVEFGEQCDGTSDAACPGACAPPATADACTCPAVCGDGFVGPGEQCDPGDLNGAPADDAACPGACASDTCQCPAPVCGNGVLELGETCELPARGCGPLEQCVGCESCAS